jgi:hypothetical protein
MDSKIICGGQEMPILMEVQNGNFGTCSILPFAATLLSFGKVAG